MTGDFKSWIERARHQRGRVPGPGHERGAARQGAARRQVHAVGSASGSLRMPCSVFSVTVTGEYADAEDDEEAYRDPDMVLRPDPARCASRPGFKTPTAFVFADAIHSDGAPWALLAAPCAEGACSTSTRERGWRPVVAPELEFYLTAPNPDPDLPLTPPAGRSGRAETSPQPYGLEAINEYEDLIDDDLRICRGRRAAPRHDDPRMRARRSWRSTSCTATRCSWPTRCWCSSASCARSR